MITPHIVFQCHHCGVKLQVPVSYAGQGGPCPQCRQFLQTPLLPHYAPPVEPPEPQRYANPASTFAAQAPSVMGRSFTKPEKSSRSLNRGILPDQAINQNHLIEKESKETTRMMLWIIAVILLLGIATFLMKSMVVGG